MIETANLATADPGGLLASLDSLAAQIPSPALAREVVVLDSGEVPAELLQTLRTRYPWISIQRIPEGTDYGDQKSMGVRAGSGEIIVFADSDCIYQPGWLSALLDGFAGDPEIEVLAGETSLAITGPFTLAMALVFIFPRFSNQKEIQRAHGFYGNNVAFRRGALSRCPFPSGLPVFRVQNVVHSRLLHQAGIAIWRHPGAKAFHGPPQGILSAIRRFFWSGRDMPRLALIQPPPRDARHQGDCEPFDRDGGRVRKVVERIRGISSRQPRVLVFLPIAVPIALACVASFCLGIFLERCRLAVGRPDYRKKNPPVFTASERRR